MRMEGVFRLRFRFFDIFARAVGGAPVIAECIGAPFRVYGSKECPGLSPSTALTLVSRVHEQLRV